MQNKNRIAECFARLKQEGRTGLVTFITAGDPDHETTAHILNALPEAGADIVELGMPFSDPMADGPAIQASSLRALKGGATMARSFELVAGFRIKNKTTPVILMGYYNPIYHYGTERFCEDAAKVGVDGLIIVDMPPEEDEELLLPARARGLDFIRLVAPTTHDARLKYVLKNAGGFIYYISIAGITGTRAPDIAKVRSRLAHLKTQTTLPVVVGFGIKTADQASALAGSADAIVVGSALTETIRQGFERGLKSEALAKDVTVFVRGLAAGLNKQSQAGRTESKGALA